MSEKRNDEGMLSVGEAELRALMGAGELERLINEFNRQPSEVDEARHEDLVAHFMSLLAQEYEITNSAPAATGKEAE